MLKSLAISTAALCVFLGGAGAGPSTEFGSIGEAKAMLQRAIAAMHKNPTKAIDEFNFNAPGFRDRDLFVFCFDRQNGTFTAHEALVGSDVRKLRDSAGRAIGDAMFAIAAEGVLSEIAILSPVPGRMAKAPKIAYIAAIGNQACGVSAYLFNGELGPMR